MRARLLLLLFILLAWAGILGLGAAPARGSSLPPVATGLPSAALSSFTDLPQGSPYFTAVDDLYQAGIVTGYEQTDGSRLFRPGQPVLRAQMAKMLILALGLDVDPALSPPFLDLGPLNPGNPYPQAYVALAAKLGVVRGEDQTHFAPWIPVTREQAVSMATRAIDALRPGRLLDPPADFQGIWAKLASPTHAANVRRAEYNLLLPGLPLADLSPQGSMSRGEAAILVDQVHLATQAATGASGMFGQVLLGPISPVERPGQVNERPYAASIQVLAADGHEVTQFSSRADGTFRLELSPGTYRLEPSPGGPVYPRAPELVVSVEAGRLGRVLIHYDTGIR